jgi:hypothetical protein
MANQRSVFVVVRQTFHIAVDAMRCCTFVASTENLSLHVIQTFILCVCAKWVGYSMAKGVCSIVLI